MATQRRSVTAIQPLKHDLVDGVHYALRVGTSCEKGDSIEISTDPCTYTSTGCGDQKIETIRGRGGDFAYMFHGIALERVSSTRITREYKLLTHGAVLAHAGSINVLEPGRKVQSGPAGSVIRATAWRNDRARSYTKFLRNGWGTIFMN